MNAQDASVAFVAGDNKQKMAIYYLAFGRVWPMVISHYIHDAMQFVMIVTLIQRGAIEL